MKARFVLKQLFLKGELVKIAGAHNGLTAKLVEEAGFDGVWSSGFEISSSHGVPDANILTMNDYLAAAAQMCDSVSIPVVADCDTGYGNSNNVIQMVKKFESAGVNAVCLEDKKFPKVNSYISGRQELASISEFVGKIMAAKSAQVSPDFMVIARVEALIAGWGIDEAVARAESYVDAGADGIFIHSKCGDLSEIRAFCERMGGRAPVVICPTTYPVSDKELKELGVNMVIYANQGLRAAIKHTKEVLAHVKAKGHWGLDDKIVPMSEVFRLQGMHVMKQEEKRFLKSDHGSVKVVIPAAGKKTDGSLKRLLSDIPVGMLDINGKTIFTRNIETLNNSGIQDISIVAGYKGEKVNVEGAHVISNPEFESKGMVYSIFLGFNEVADRNIVLYSDILVDQSVIKGLLEKKGDIVLLVDATFRKTRVRNKKLELVICEGQPSGSIRVLDLARKARVLEIGTGVKEKDAHYEFIGVAMISKKAIAAIKKELLSDSSIRDKYSFAELVNYLINSGMEVSAHEVAGGWMEIHDFENYKEACNLFSF